MGVSMMGANYGNPRKRTPACANSHVSTLHGLEQLHAVVNCQCQAIWTGAACFVGSPHAAISFKGAFP